MTWIADLRTLLLAGALAALPAAASAQAPEGGASAPEAVAGSGSVAGRVLSVVGRTPLERATVLIADRRGTLRTANTDAAGRYRFDGLPAGHLTLSVHTADHAPYEVDLEVPTGAEIRVDVVLSLDPPVLEPLHAEGERPLLAPAAPTTASGETASGRPTDPELRSLETGPGGGLLVGALAVRPDPPPSDPGGALYVRGGASDLKRVYLDGAPVYTPFHLGGLMDAVPEGVLRSARLYTGGAPLAYDGGLSYVLDLRTRAGVGEVRTAGHLDVMSGAVRAEGGGERASWLLSGRRAHAGTADWLVGGDLPYGYYDALGRADLYLAAGHRIALTGFANEERVRLGRTGAAAVEPVAEGARWGNRAASLRYRGEAGATHLLATAAASGFETELPVSSEPDRLARSETRHARLSVDAVTEVEGLDLAYGAAFEGQRLDLALPPGTAEEGIRWRGDGGSLSLYGAATIRASETVSLTGGLRGYAFGDGAGLRVGPRLSVALRASESTRVEIGGGRFHQRLGAPESVLSSDLDLWTEVLRRESTPGDADADGVSGFPALAVASASHLDVRLDHRPDESLSLGLEGYFKTFDELAAGDDLHASGAELWADWRGDGWRAWGGYSLAWAWSDAPPDSGAVGFTGRQLVSAGAEAELPSAVRLSAELRASSGLPFTRVPIAPAEPDAGPTGQEPPSTPGSGPERDLGLAGPPDGSYLRLDLSVSRRWSVELMGRSTGLRPYVRVLNALDRRDALFYQFDPSGELTPRALDTMPLVPVVGIAWDVG